MIRHILTVCAAVAMGAAATSVASAQGYQPSGATTYSAAPAGYPADYQRPATMNGVPDYDAVDDAGDQGTAALPPPGPVMSPDDPRYGAPMNPQVIYSDRGNPGQAQPGYDNDAGNGAIRPPGSIDGGHTAAIPPQGIVSPDALREEEALDTIAVPDALLHQNLPLPHDATPIFFVVIRYP